LPSVSLKCRKYKNCAMCSALHKATEVKGLHVYIYCMGKIIVYSLVEHLIGIGKPLALIVSLFCKTQKKESSVLQNNGGHDDMMNAHYFMMFCYVNAIHK